MKRKLHGFIWREGDAWVSQCVELDIASCGDTAEEAETNLIEALELHFEHPSDTVMVSPFNFLVPAGDFEFETVIIDCRFD